MAGPEFMELWGKESPETMQAFFNLGDTLQNSGGLDAKTFQLVYIALQASRGAVGSVAAHAAFAKKAGVTRDEMRGAVLMSLMVAGVNGVADCLVAAMKAYDDAPV